MMPFANILNPRANLFRVPLEQHELANRTVNGVASGLFKVLKGYVPLKNPQRDKGVWRSRLVGRFVSTQATATAALPQ